MALTDYGINLIAQRYGLQVRNEDGLSWYRDDYDDELWGMVRPVPAKWTRLQLPAAGWIREPPKGMVELYDREMYNAARSTRGQTVVEWLTDSLGVSSMDVAPEVTDKLADFLYASLARTGESAERAAIRLLERVEALRK